MKKFRQRLLGFVIVFICFFYDGMISEAAWIKDSVGWWWQEEDGTYPAQQWKYVNGEWYYFDASGYMATGWRYVNGKWYYLSEDGHMLANTWVDGYYVDGTGAYVSYNEPSRWIHSGNQWWYRHGDGSYTVNGWELIYGKWYFFDEAGWMKSGWLKRGDHWYYLGDDNDGAMKANMWVGEYYLDSDGIMAVDKMILGQYVDESGKRVFTVSDNEWVITQYSSVTGNQSMFYTLVSADGRLIIIDGGWKEDADAVRKIIHKYNNTVDLWICTHFHMDHIGAVNDILANPDGITIKELFCPQMDMDTYNSFAKFYDTADTCSEFLSLIQGKSYVRMIHSGDTVSRYGLQFNFFSAFDSNNLKTFEGNRCGLLFKVTGNRESILFCADVGGNFLSNDIIEKYGDELGATYIQMGHHGNGGMSKRFYLAVQPEYAFFDAPDWLFDDPEGKYTSLQNRAIMESMGCVIYSFRSAPNRVVLK